MHSPVPKPDDDHPASKIIDAARVRKWMWAGAFIALASAILVASLVAIFLVGDMSRVRDPAVGRVFLFPGRGAPRFVNGYGFVASLVTYGSFLSASAAWAFFIHLSWREGAQLKRELRMWAADPSDSRSRWARWILQCLRIRSRILAFALGPARGRRRTPADGPLPPVARQREPRS
jgi:hypothetical protein